MKSNWLENKLVVLALLIFIWPVGVFVLWKNKRFSKVSKIALTVFLGLFIALGFLGSEREQKKAQAVQDAEQTTPRPVTREQEDVQPFVQAALDGDEEAQIVVGYNCADLTQSYAWLWVVSHGTNEASKTAAKALSIRNERYQGHIKEGEQLAEKLYKERQEIEQNRTAARQKAKQEIEQNQTLMVQKARQEKFIIGVGFTVPDSAVVAALNGNANAQDIVAGWSSDWVHQYAWYSLAAAQGNEHAARFRAQVLRSLSPQIEKGEQLILKLEQEIKQNQAVAMQRAEQDKAQEEAHALQKAEQKKKIELAFAEIASEVEKEFDRQEKGKALAREKELQQERKDALAARKEREARGEPSASEIMEARIKAAAAAAEYRATHGELKFHENR
jgi:hypothetical protein